MVMAELGQGNQGNQICPGSGAQRPGVLGTASPTASCWGTLLSRGAPLALGTGPPFVRGSSYTGPAPQSGPGAACGTQAVSWSIH